MLRAVGMIEAGATQIDVSEAMGTSQSVISRLWSRYRVTGQVVERHRGPQRITTHEQDRFIRNTARRQPNVTAMQLVQRLQREYGLLVSGQTLRRRLHEVNLRARRPLRVPALRRGNRGRRLQWAIAHENWNNFQWSLVLFTDESRFGFHPDSRRVRVWREPGRWNRLQHPQQVHAYQGGTIMVWAGICLGGRTDLVWIQGNMTALKYRDEVLEPVILPHRQQMGENFQLMHDNARPHTARIVTSWLQQHDIQALDWPAQSPDLNPIEHAWDMLQRRALKNFPEDIVHENQLFLHLSRTWDNIPQQDIDTLVLSMQNRCRCVRRVLGGSTDY